MDITILEAKKQPVFKIEKIEDYYNFFVSMQHTEDQVLHNMEHLWILGIDKNNYSACAYLVGYGIKINFDYFAHELFSLSIQYRCKKIIMAHNRSTSSKVQITKDDIFFANSVYHRGKFLGIELYDYIILGACMNNSMIHTSMKPDFGSFREADLLKELEKDISYIPYIELKDKLDDEKEEHGKHEREKEKIEIAEKMLIKNMSFDLITEITGLSEEYILKIQKSM